MLDCSHFPSCDLKMLSPHIVLTPVLLSRRLLKNLPDSLSNLLELASQSSSAQRPNAVPGPAAQQHQAVQQELILGEADEWRGLLVQLLPTLKQVRSNASMRPVSLNK